MLKYLIYPNPDFTPVTTHTPDGILVAYDKVSDIWSSSDRLFFKRNRLGHWTRRTVSQLYRQKRYCSPTSTGTSSGDSYPHIDNFRVHKIVARAWIGPIPQGWEVDHIDGNVLNFSRDNIRIVHKTINHRDGGFLRKLRNNGINPRMYAAPILLRYFKRMAKFNSSHVKRQYDNLTREELLHLLVGPKYNVVDPTIAAAEEPDKYL